MDKLYQLIKNKAIFHKDFFIDDVEGIEFYKYEIYGDIFNICFNKSHASFSSIDNYQDFLINKTIDFIITELGKRKLNELIN